jgi:hypothetical protein
MITSVLIIAVSALLLVYWLRYSCLILIRDLQTNAELSRTSDQRFSLATVIQGLKTEGDLDPLERALERDYRVIMYLMEHTDDLASIENKLLVVDCKLMRIWSRLTRTLAPRQSRIALSEMAAVLTVLASQMGEQNQLQLEA